MGEKKSFMEMSSPQNIQSVAGSVISFEQENIDVLEIIGKRFETDSTGKPTLDGMKRLSMAMEIYSDKRYETARYLFVKNGVITRHIAVSSQSPSSTIIKPDDKFLYQLKNYAKETGSKIVFLHNHPSGYVEPSEADIKLTDYLANFFEESDGSNTFSGHIILDHGTYGLYESENRSWNALINDELKPLSEIKNNYKPYLSKHGKKTDFYPDHSVTEHSLEKLADYAKSCDAGNVWNRKDWIPSFLLTGNGIVTSLEYINTVELRNEETLSEKLKFLGRKYGSENIVMLPSDKRQFLICERYAQDSGKIKDVFLENQDGTFEMSEYRNGNIFNDLRNDEIKVEDTERYIEKVKKKIVYESSVNKNIDKEPMDDKENKSESDISEKNYPKAMVNDNLMAEKTFPNADAVEIEEPMDILDDNPAPEQNNAVEQTDNNTQISDLLEEMKRKDAKIDALMKQNQALLEQNQMFSQKLAALEEHILAPKEVQEKSANDSMGAGYSSYGSQQNLANKDGFGRESAYKKNQKVPVFGIKQPNGSHRLVKNAVFSKIIENEENPANNKIELLVLKENGKQEVMQIEERIYNQIIANVQAFEEQKLGQSHDSWNWMKVHLDYAQKMGIDDNSFRLNSSENFIHNFRVHCMRDEAHNPEQALKIAGIMFEKMSKRDKERFLQDRKAWDEKAKNDGGPSFDEFLLEQFNEFHPKKEINPSEINDHHFNAEESVDKQNLLYESIRSGKIADTNTSIGDTVPFAMKYKDPFSGNELKTPKEDWKVIEVSKCLHGDRALIYNEKSKAYYKIPLENLVDQIRKNERIKSREEKEILKSNYKKLGYDGPER